uniref:Uncharacterized protein n=1 Tax=Cacopsylla melanoneura TaxID=428564 RepID=A0A8D8M480_9HEMI
MMRLSNANFLDISRLELFPMTLKPFTRRPMKTSELTPSMSRKRRRHHQLTPRPKSTSPRDGTRRSSLWLNAKNVLLPPRLTSLRSWAKKVVKFCEWVSFTISFSLNTT